MGEHGKKEYISISFAQIGDKQWSIRPSKEESEYNAADGWKIMCYP